MSGAAAAAVVVVVRQGPRAAGRGRGGRGPAGMGTVRDSKGCAGSLHPGVARGRGACDRDGVAWGEWEEGARTRPLCIELDVRVLTCRRCGHGGAMCESGNESGINVVCVLGRSSCKQRAYLR